LPQLAGSSDLPTQSSHSPQGFWHCGTGVQGLTIRDSLDAKNKLVSDEVKSVIEKAGANPDPGALFGALRPKLDEGRANAQKAVAEAKGILTAEQWAKLPERIKNPGQQGPGARGPRSQ